MWIKTLMIAISFAIGMYYIWKINGEMVYLELKYELPKKSFNWGKK